jgi:hypothetical protein
MEKRLAKAGRTEEFNKQFQDNVERGTLDVEKGRDWRVQRPLNYITMVGAYKWPICTNTPQDMNEQQYEPAAPFR